MKRIYKKFGQQEFINRMGDSFPSNYLTIISVIQAVALGLLIENVLKDGFSINKVFYAIMSFATIVTVFYEYSWFVGIHRWVMRIPDILIPLLLGITEVLPLFYFSNPRYWWMCNAALCFVAAIAFMNTGFHSIIKGIIKGEKIFSKKKAQILITKGILRQVGMTLSMSIVIIISLRYVDNDENWNPLEIILLSVYFLSSCFLVISDQRFIKKLHKLLKLKYQ